VDFGFPSLRKREVDIDPALATAQVSSAAPRISKRLLEATEEEGSS
jgi:hypothetical protein